MGSGVSKKPFSYVYPLHRIYPRVLCRFLTLLSIRMYVCVRACVRTCVDACRENARVGLYIAASCFIGTNLSLVWYIPLSANAINELFNLFLFFCAFRYFSLDIIFFFFIATSKAIPNYPSLNIQRMGRKGNEMGEVYYVISFSKEIWKICLFPASWYSGVYVVVSNRYFLIKFHVSHSLIKRRIFPLIFEES